MRVCAWCGSEMPSKGEREVTHGICSACASVLFSGTPVSLQNYLDDLSVPVLVVDSDVTVALANREAQKVIGKPLEAIAQKKGGEIFSCIHARHPDGCGRTIHCSACTIRACVEKTHATGEPQIMVPATLKQSDPDAISAVTMNITTVKRDDLVLLLINKVE